MRARMSKGGIMPTIVRNSARLWVPALGRWLLAKELSVALGWAVTREYAEVAALERPMPIHSVAQLGVHGERDFPPPLYQKEKKSCLRRGLGGGLPHQWGKGWGLGGGLPHQLTFSPYPLLTE